MVERYLFKNKKEKDIGRCALCVVLGHVCHNVRRGLLWKRVCYLRNIAFWGLPFFHAVPEQCNLRVVYCLLCNSIFCLGDIFNLTVCSTGHFWMLVRHALPFGCLTYEHSKAATVCHIGRCFVGGSLNWYNPKSDQLKVHYQAWLVSLILWAGLVRPLGSS